MALLIALAGCGGDGGSPSATVPVAISPPRDVSAVQSTAVATFAAPWALAFIPDGRLLVTERVTDEYVPGKLWLVTQAGAANLITGLPANLGILDVITDPKVVTNRIIYFTFLEPAAPGEPRVGRDAADQTVPSTGIAVASAALNIHTDGTAQLDGLKVIWRQQPKIVSYPGSGEPGGRMTFSPDGKYLFVAAGDRQEFDPVQQLSNTLGKIVRIFPDGTIPTDNPFSGKAGALPEIWTLGHRNQYGLAFDVNGLLWENEMGPAGGDELNLIEAASNYGWPLVSYGSTYDIPPIKYPDPKPGDGFHLAAYQWTPVIAPSGMIFYSGTVFAAWKGDAILSGLKSQALIRMHFSGTTATEAQRIPMGARIRAVVQGPDGAIWVLEDAPTGRLLKLAPVFG